MSRRLSEYEAINPTEIQIGGTAPKWILRRKGGADSADLIIAKLGAKNGRIEVLTELFNNLLGARLGFSMAECGLGNLDGQYYFLSRNFLQSGQRLVHGSLVIEDMLSAPKETARVSRQQEQNFYSLDFLYDVFQQFCQGSADSVFQEFVEMLVFDALIGSTDRHSMNWGLVISTEGNSAPKFSPIFDSAHALLWDLNSCKLENLERTPSGIVHYANRAFPCIGPPRVPGSARCNHFGLVHSLGENFPQFLLRPATRLGGDVGNLADELLDEFPFTRNSDGARKRLIVKVVRHRAARIRKILEGGNP